MSFGRTLRKCLVGQISLAGTPWQRLLRNAPLIAIAGGCVVLTLEPDHTSDLPLLVAFGLWSTHILFALLLFVGSLAAIVRMGLPDPLPAVAATLLLPAIFAPVSLLLDAGFGKPDDELVSGASLISIYVSEVAAVAPVTFGAALVTLIALYRDAALREARRTPLEAKSIPQVPVLSDLITAIPRSLGDDIIRMRAQDHYVEVVTVEGKSLVNDRFSDCVEKLDQINGMRCHRSHWISLHHVETVIPSGSAYVCTLSNGDQVPVSRRRYLELKQRVRSNLRDRSPVSYADR